jgi:hypothetical protein
MSAITLVITNGWCEVYATWAWEGIWRSYAAGWQSARQPHSADSSIVPVARRSSRIGCCTPPSRSRVERAQGFAWQEGLGNRHALLRTASEPVGFAPADEPRRRLLTARVLQ